MIHWVYFVFSCYLCRWQYVLPRSLVYPVQSLYVGVCYSYCHFWADI